MTPILWCIRLVAMLKGRMRRTTCDSPPAPADALIISFGATAQDHLGYHAIAEQNHDHRSEELGECILASPSHTNPYVFCFLKPVPVARCHGGRAGLLVLVVLASRWGDCHGVGGHILQVVSVFVGDIEVLVCGWKRSNLCCHFGKGTESGEDLGRVQQLYEWSRSGMVAKR